MLKETDDNLCRVELMARSPKWDLSTNDRTALTAVLNDRKELAERVKQYKARLKSIDDANERLIAKKPPEPWEIAIDQCDEILSDISDLPERAHEFGSSIEAKVVAIKEWIEEAKYVTDAQTEALANMQIGVQKWLR